MTMNERIYVLEAKTSMNNTYLGQIEKGRDNKVAVYGTKEGFKLVFTFFYNDRTECDRKECNLLDGDHVARELEHLGYSQSFIDVILSML